MIKAVLDRNKIKNKFHNFIKRVLLITILVTNIFYYVPMSSFAADEEDTDKKTPALVPYVANQIISKYVSTNITGVSTEGTADTSTYEETGDGYYSLTRVNDKVYKNYRQNLVSYAYTQKYFGGKNFGGTACGPTTLAIIASGYGIDKTPGEIASIITTKYGDFTSADTLSKALNDLGLKHERKYGSDSTETKVKNIKANLEAGNPVAVGVNPSKYSSGGHWIAILAIDGDTITISNPWRTEGEEHVYRDDGQYGIGDKGTSTANINDFVSTNMQNCAYILIKGTNSNSNTTSNASANSNTGTSKSTGTGEAQTTKYNVENDGYDAIFTSGTTGRQFKEYKQNIPGWNSKYPISHLPSTNKDWTGECGLVSTIIIGSGYSEKATFADATSNMESTGGSTNILGWTGKYVGQNVSFVSYNSNDMVNKLSNGCVAIIHGTSSNVSSGGTHYMAILDIKADKSEVYVSNPWDGSQYQGWISVNTVNSDFGADSIAYITNDGSTVDYGSGTGVASLDNFLFIGDSRTAAIESKLEALGNNITAKGVSSSTPQNWKEVTKNGNGTVLNTSVTLPSKSNVKGVSVALGVNGTSQVSDMKDVLNNLVARYPDTPIFVNSVFYVGSGYQLGTLDANTMNSNIDEFNKSIKEFCNTNSDLIYIDVTSGLYDSGALKSSYTGDNVHLNNSGNSILVENIKKAILSSGRVVSSGSSNTVNMSGNITKNDRGGYKIDIDLDKEVDNMLKKLKKNGFNMSSYLSSSKQKEYLKNMIKAAIVTQYPDLRAANEIASDAGIPANEVQGCIKIKRYADGETEAFAGNSLSNPKDSDDGIYLSYKPYDEFTDLIGNGNKSALNYFSLDSSNNIVVAGWETMDVQISQTKQTGSDPEGMTAPSTYIEEIEPKNEPYSRLTIKNVSYLNQVSNYIMPFSLLWTLLVYGNDETFINDLAELVIDTEIVIGCYDATNTRVTNYEFPYHVRDYVESTAYLPDPTDNTPYASTTEELSTIEVEYYFTATETDTLKTDSLTLKVKYANTWTAVYNNDYMVETTQTKADEEIVELEDERLQTNYYQKIDNEYSGDRKPENTDVAEQLDEIIEDETDEILNSQIESLRQSVESYNQKYEYRYTYITKVIEKQKDIQTNGINEFAYPLLQKKEVQSYIINMILDQSYDDSVFTSKNAEILKYAKEISTENVDICLAEAGRTVKNIIEQSGTEYEPEDEVYGSGIYNELTKEGSGKVKTYNAEITSIQIEEKIDKTDQKEIINQDITTSKVKNVPTQDDNNVRWKDDKDANENSFVKLLAHSKSAKSNLRIINSWFFESLEGTAAIADLADLMRYLFECVYNTDYGVSQERIDELKNLFDPTKMKKVSRTELTGGTIQEQVWNFFINEGFSDAAAAGILGNIEHESVWDPALDIAPCGGLFCFEKSTGCFAEMQAYASSQGKDWTDVQCQLEFLMTQLPSTFTTYTGIGPYYYSTGEWCWWPTPMTLDEFKTLTDTQEAAEIFCRVYERPSITHLDRRQATAQKYYDMYHGG